ncbi:MAG: hypothetical protein ACRECH_00895 [Nitrososphaerales archaeon]
MKLWGKKCDPVYDDEYELQRARNYVFSKDDEDGQSNMTVAANWSKWGSLGYPNFLWIKGETYGWIPKVKVENEYGPGRPIRIKDLKGELALEYYEETGKAAKAEYLSSAITILQQMALSGEKVNLYLRARLEDEAVYVDVGDLDWSMWRITKNGYEKMAQDRPLFNREVNTKELAEGYLNGSLEDIKQFLKYFHVSDDYGILLIGWLGVFFIGQIPHAILTVTGPQGAAKSAFLTAIKRVVDNTMPLINKTAHGDADFVQKLAHQYAPCFDNLTPSDDNAVADTLCRL